MLFQVRVVDVITVEADSEAEALQRADTLVEFSAKHGTIAGLASEGESFGDGPTYEIVQREPGDE